VAIDHAASASLPEDANHGGSKGRRQQGTPMSLTELAALTKSDHEKLSVTEDRGMSLQ
jgi:hypothetical protein